MPLAQLTRHLALAALALTLGACPSKTPPGPAPSRPQHLTLPVAELSGLALSHAPDGSATLLAIGDDDERLLQIPLDRLGSEPARAVPLGRQGRELEAVALDEAGHVFVLDEPGAQIFALELRDGRRHLVHTYKIDIPKGHPLHKSWRKHDNARGEGLLVLGGGRFLLAKQKKPAALIELGPAGTLPVSIGTETHPGASLPPGDETVIVPLAWWRLPKKAPLRSLNDLARGPRGELYVVGSKPRGLVARVTLPLTPEEPRFQISERWRVPKLDGGKAEGLAITRDGRALVGLDGDEGDPNLVILPLSR